MAIAKSIFAHSGSTTPPLLALRNATECDTFEISVFNRCAVYLSHRSPDTRVRLSAGEACALACLHPMEFEESPFLTYLAIRHAREHVGKNAACSRAENSDDAIFAVVSDGAYLDILHCSSLEMTGSSVSILEEYRGDMRGLSPFKHVVSSVIMTGIPQLCPKGAQLDERIRCWKKSKDKWGDIIDPSWTTGMYLRDDESGDSE